MFYNNSSKEKANKISKENENDLIFFVFSHDNYVLLPPFSWFIITLYSLFEWWDVHRIVTNMAIITLEIKKINQSSKISAQLKGEPPLVSKVCRMIAKTNNAPIKESTKTINLFFFIPFFSISFTPVFFLTPHYKLIILLCNYGVNMKQNHYMKKLHSLVLFCMSYFYLQYPR